MCAGGPWGANRLASAAVVGDRSTQQALGTPAQDRASPVVSCLTLVLGLRVAAGRTVQDGTW